jgi:gliding motility-associated-like protein
MIMSWTKQVWMGMLLLLCGSLCYGQNITNKGTDFWVGYGHHQFMEQATNSQNMVLYISAEEAATVTVTIDSSGPAFLPANWWRRTYNIPANTVINTGTFSATSWTTIAGQTGPMPKSVTTYDSRLYDDPPPAGFGGERIFRARGIRITSNVPIVAYAHIYGSVSSGATMLLPTPSWGYAYTTINSEQVNAGGPGYNWFYIIAKENNTVVEITPAAVSRLGKPAGVPFQINLMKGQIYQYVGQADGGGNGVELTGSKIKSIANSSGQCYPIAVFAGSSRTRGESVPCGTGSGRDNDMQQCFPQQSWGKRYLTAPFSTASGSTSNPTLNASTSQTSVYKIVVRDPSTVVRRNGVQLTGLIGGTHYKYSSNTADYIESDKPIMVGQFMSGSSTCNPGTFGDPEMVFLSPIEQAIKSVGCYRNTLEAIYANYVTLIIPTGGVPSLRIDGSNMFNHTYAHPNRPGYTVVVKGWAAAQAQIKIQSDSAFTGLTYGLGGAESYAFNVGSNLNNINGLPGFHNAPDTSATSVIHPYGYVNTPMEVGAYIAYKPTAMTWKLSALAAVVTPNADVTINNPTPLDSLVIGAAKFYLYRLPGTYLFNPAGTYYLPILLNSPSPDNGDCNNQETVNIEIIIRPKPSATFTYTQTGSCGVDTTRFTSPATTAQGYSIIKWKWNFPNGDTSALQNPAYLFPAAGTYPVKLTVTVLHGGIADTTINVVVTSGSRPFSNFGANPSVVCLGQPVTLSDSTNYTNTVGWWWDYGNGTTITATNNANQVINYTMPGTYIVRHTINITGASCIADTINRTVIVSATPNITGSNAVSPTTCGGGNGSITLNGLLPNTPYAVAYTFNGTPQTATITTNGTGVLTLPNLATGTYTNISVSIGSCSSNTVGPLSITNPTAPATPTAVDNSPVCEGGTINLLASTTTLGTIVFAWTGPNGFTSNLSNPSINSATTAMAGVYSVTATQNNCTSSAGTVTVQINPLPVIGASSSTNPTTCGTATGTITLSGLLATTSYTIEYTQNGNTYPGTIVSDASGNVVIPSLTTGTYTNVRVALNSCWSAGVGPFVLSDPNPPAVPTVSNNTPICNGGIIQLNASSATMGTIIYSWTGPNSFVSTTQNPLINGATVAASGTYSVTAFLNGCTSAAATTTVVVNQTPAIPTAGSNSPVCVGAALNLTATTTTSGAIGYTWTGPNGFNSTTQNPSIATVALSDAGTYSVTAAQNGCTSSAGTVNINVNPVPTIATNSSSNPSTCNGTNGSIILNGLTANTIFSVNYTKGGTAQAPATISTDGSGVLTLANLSAGNYTNITVTLNGCSSAAVGPFVLSDPNPPAVPTVNNNSPICNGGTINLTASSTSPGMLTYSWTGPNGFTSSLQNPQITNAAVAASGNYSVTVSYLGCTSAAATTSVTVNPIPVLPTAGSNSPLCVGAALNLNATTTTTGAIGYTWTGPNGFNSTTQNPSIATVNLSNAGTYSVTASQNGCTSSAGTVNVTVNPVPSIATNTSSNPTTCNGTNGSITLNGLTANTIYTVNFTKGGTAQTPATISTDGSGVLTISGLTAGNYTNITITLNGCTSAAVGPFVLSDPNPPAVPTVNNNSPICQNTTLNLTAASATSGTVTYNWTGPNSFTSGVQNPSITNVTTAATGTYSVTATLNGCTSAAGTTTVTINPSPTISSTASSNPTSCATATGTITLNGLAPNTLHAINYTFNGNPATALTGTTTAGGSITLTALASGTYANITATLNGCTSAPVGPISLSDPNPPATPTVTGSTPICAGTNINLTANTTTTGAITYTWSGPNGFNSTSQNPTITAATVAASGTYSVTATLNSCTSAAGSVAVVVNPIPVFVGTSLTNPSTCNSATGSITLSGLTPAATYTVNYSKNGTPQTATITANAGGNVIIPNLTAGNYTGITVTLNGCTSTSIASATLTDPAPPAVPTVTNSGPHCEGITLNLTAASTTPGAVTYTWTGPNSFASTQQNPSITTTTVNNSGVYSVIATLNGCTSAAGTTNAVINVVPAQPLASSNTPICAGTALNLTATTATPGAVTYAWNGPSGFTSAQQNPTIATAGLAAAGNYQVTASLNGCTSTSGVTSVVVNGVPAIGGTSTVNPTTCNTATGNISLNGLVANATYTVNFSRNGTAQTAQTITANASGVVVIPTLTAGNYTNITVTFNNCVSNSIASVTLNDPNAPVVPVITNNTPICEGVNVNLTATSSTPGALTYAWTGPNGFSTAVQNPSITNATVTASGTYSVTASLNGCTSAPATTNVVVNQTPALPTTTSNSPICSGNTINLTATTTTSGTINYSWTGPNGFTSNAQNPNIPAATVAASGTYSVIASQGSCFSPAATVNVVVNLTPAITATSMNPTDCNSATGAITLAGLTPNASFTVNYLKNGSAQSGTQSADGSGNLVIANLTAGTYTNITVTANTCISNSISSITLTDPLPPAIPVISNNGPLCEGATLILGATTTTSGTISWSWSGPNGFTSNLQNPSIVSSTTAATGNYTVTATQNSCSSSASRVVNINPYPVVNFGTPAFVCMPNGVATFTNQTTIPDNSSISFAWDFGDASGSSFTTDGSHVYSAISNYNVKLTATSSNGCSREITKPFNAFFDKPVADFTVNPQTICQGVDNVFTDNSSAPNSTIAGRVWSFGDGSTATSTNPTKRYTNPGKYGVQLVVTNTQGCISDPFIDSVTVYLQPVIDAGISFVVPLNTSITFNPTTNDPSLVFAWSPSTDFANPNVLRPTITATKNQVYTIRATGSGNCTATDTLSVKVLRPIKVPNAFSPNGDGINDTWGIENLADYPGAVVEIFDRSGAVIYRAFNYGTPWDGTRNGKPVPVGTYYYIIQPKNTFQQISGFVVLLR